MHLYIYSLEKKIYEGETTSITMPTSTGEITVLPHHEPLVTTMAKGKIVFKNSSGETKSEFIEGGFAEIKSGSVILLVK